MFIEFLTPEVFDVIIIINIVIGLLIAGRRFRRDISVPLPDDTPPSARPTYESLRSSSPPSSDS